MMGLKQLLALIGCGLVGLSFGAAWPTFHGEADLRGFSSAVLPDKPELIWRFQGRYPVDSTPVSGGKQIVVAERKGRVLALDLEGSLLWEQTLVRTNQAGHMVAEQVEAPLAVFEGVVLVNTRNGTVYALAADSGRVRWRYDTGGILIASATRLSESMVAVVEQSEGVVHALDLKTGRCRWITQGTERCDGPLSVANGRIAFGSCAAAIHLFSATNGVSLFHIALGDESQVAGGVALNGNVAYVGTRMGHLVCADLNETSVRWVFEGAEDQAFGTPAIGLEQVVYAADDGCVYALQRGGAATLLWKVEVGGIPSSPVISGDKVAVSADGVLYLIRLSTGEIIWSEAVSDEISSPSVVDGLLLVGADDGSVTAFGERISK